jgi:hypothetical protein
MGGTNVTFWPGLVATGDQVAQYPTNNRPLTAVEALDGGNFSPNLATLEAYTASGDGVYDYLFKIGSSNKMEAVDNAAFTFGDSAVDAPFSVGCFVKPTGFATHQMLLTKWENTNTLREWEIFIASGSGKLQVLLWDESSDGSESAVAGVGLMANQWCFCVATYDGDEVTPAVNIYCNGALNNDGDGDATTEGGAYTAMEDVNCPMFVGCRGDNGAAILPLNGYMALPFVCGKELSATEVRRMMAVGVQLMGGM